MITGFIKKIYCDKRNINISEDNSDDEEEYNNLENENKKITTHYVILDIIDKDFEKYKIKGNTILKPEENDIITIANYNIINNDKYKQIEYEAEKDVLIDLQLPQEKNKIIERLDILKIQKYGKKRIDNIISKMTNPTDIWQIKKLDLLKINDKSNKIFYDAIQNYIKEKNENYNSASDLLVKYFIDEYNISFTKNEINKIREYTNKDKLENSIEQFNIEKLLLTICGYINNDKILKILNINKILTEKQKTKIMILHSIRNDFINNKNSCISIKYLHKIFDKNTEIDFCIEELINEEYIVNYNNYIYQKENYDCEYNIAKQLYNIYNRDDKNIKISECHNTIIKNNEQLSDEQYSALLNMLNNRISIISGGPGCGKTTIIKNLLDLCKINKDECIILGPTGKVVSRIKEDITDEYENCTILTIHKYIYLNKTDTSKYDNNIHRKEYMSKLLEKLEKPTFIIIDEMSMVSNKLFEQIINIISKHDSYLILLGDKDQLPSIDYGIVFDKLIKSKCIPITFLTIPYRYKDVADLRNAIDKINKKEIPINDINYKYITTNCKEHMDLELEKIIYDIMEKHKNLNNTMIITPTKNIINKYQMNIKKIYQNHNNKEYNFNNEFEIGDYIIIKKNIYTYKLQDHDYTFDDYEDGMKIQKINFEYKDFDLFNGMIGQIKDIIKNYEKSYDYYEILINNKHVYIEKNFFNEKIINDYSYINTVHKYQGSENDNVIFVLPDYFIPKFLQKELIFTAVSRAKKNCIVVGDENVYKSMINNYKQRISKLDDIIKDIFKKTENKNDECDETEKKQIILNNKTFGISTLYDGILYRSRIEAKWSYIFKILKWNYQYESIDMNYYIPDFIVSSKCGNIKNLMIEVKNEIGDDNFKNHYIKAINGGCKGTLLILNGEFREISNKSLKINNFENCINIGKIYFNMKNKIRTSDFIIYKDEYDDFSCCYLYKKKIYNKIDKICIIDEQIIFQNKMSILDKKYFENNWDKITNDVRYKRLIKKEKLI